MNETSALIDLAFQIAMNSDIAYSTRVEAMKAYASLVQVKEREEKNED